MFRLAFYKTLFIFVILSHAYAGIAQKKSSLIKIKNAESLTFDQERNDAKILKGNVICEHEGALLHCDSAYIYEKENKMEAQGHILITKGDSIRITGEKLIYEGKNKLATLHTNVRCVEKDMILTTQLMTFDLDHSVANYYNGGTIVNNQNVLTSKNGHYYSGTKEATFHYDVELTNPEYTMRSDTLKYRITNKTSYFLGPSIITSKSDYIYCENGWYDTQYEKAQFSHNAVLVTSQQKLSGDSLTYDRTNKIGKAFRNVQMIDTAQRSIIYGNYAIYKEKKSEAMVTGKAIYARILENDTVFVAADTLYHLDIDSVSNLLNAYRHVKIFNKQVQGNCDSASFNTKDSVMQLFYSPVIWGQYSQASARHMKVEIGKQKVKGFRLEGNAFLMQQADTVNKDKYNQLSGKSISGILSNDSIRRVLISGNVELLYFPKNKNKIMGLNNTNCSEVLIWFKKNDVDRVTLKPRSGGTLTPLKDVDLVNAKLKGFNWQYHKRPLSKAELHTNK